MQAPNTLHNHTLLGLPKGPPQTFMTPPPHPSYPPSGPTGLLATQRPLLTGLPSTYLLAKPNPSNDCPLQMLPVADLYMSPSCLTSGSQTPPAEAPKHLQGWAQRQPLQDFLFVLIQEAIDLPHGRQVQLI